MGEGRSVWGLRKFFGNLLDVLSVFDFGGYAITLFPDDTNQNRFSLGKIAGATTLCALSYVLRFWEEMPRRNALPVFLKVD